MTDKSTEDMLREQAQAVRKVQEEALKSQMQMMESLYGNNPEMLAMMKAQIQQSLANQSALVEQAQTAAFEAVAAAQRGEGFDPQALVSTLQQNAQSMGYGLPVKTDADREEGYAQALNFIGQLQTEFTEPPARSVPRGSREARVFGYLLGGIVGTLNGHELEQLDPEAHEAFYEEQVRSILSDYWGIETAEELEERSDKDVRACGKDVRPEEIVPVRAVALCEPVEEPDRLLEKHLELPGDELEPGDHEDADDRREHEDDPRDDECRDEPRIDRQSEEADLIPFVQDGVLHRILDRRIFHIQPVRQNNADDERGNDDGDDAEKDTRLLFSHAPSLNRAHGTRRPFKPFLL